MTSVSVNYNYDIEVARPQEFPNLRDTVYVDHAGATLYSKSQMEAVHKDLMSNLYGNPHSHNASSKLASDTVDQIRSRLLQMFNTNHKEYSLIFTSGCTASLQIIANCFQFGNDKAGNQQGIFCYLEDNHTSVQGMREVVADRCSGIFCLNKKEFARALSETKPTATSGSSSVDPDVANGEFPTPSGPQSLVAFPAQSNFSGYKYPLEWVLKCQGTGLSLASHKPSDEERWFVLLDTAAYVSTSPLDLSSVKPDFATVSFYKMFGYPTGIGALLVHKRAWSTLHKRYFGGGTVAASTAKGRFHAFWKSLHDRFEDGTVPFLNIISLKHGLDTVQKLAGGMQGVCEHVFAVAQYFYQNLSKLQHGNSQPLAEIYGGVKFETPGGQGGVVTFNILRADGAYVGYSEVDKFANLHDVHVRTGCFCNIGACQRFLNLSNSLIKENFDAGHVCGDNMDMIAGRPTGAVRISFGYMSTIADARVCLRFIADSFLEKPVTIPSFPNPEWYNPEKASHNKDVQVNGVNKSMSVDANTKPDSSQTPSFPDVPKVLPRTVVANSAGVSSSNGPKVMKLTDIHLYPLKSCGAFKVSEWEMGSKGLLYDREWILVTDAGVTIGQKKIPQICMLTPHIDLETRRFTLFFPGAERFVLPLDQDEESDSSASLCTNKVCGDRVNTFDCGDAVSAWLSEVLEFSGVRLLRQQSGDTRKSKLREKQTSGDQVPSPQKLSMANESQILLLHRASVRSLQAKMSELGTLEEADDTRVPTIPEDI
ncbi:molybdenum cofactor sulfurase, partial [Elysia marginata]